MRVTGMRLTRRKHNGIGLVIAMYLSPERKQRNGLGARRPLVAAAPVSPADRNGRATKLIDSGAQSGSLTQSTARRVSFIRSMIAADEAGATEAPA